MKTNLRLELDALILLRKEYQAAVTNDESMFVLMEIKMRLDVIKEICLEDMLDQVG